MNTAHSFDRKSQPPSQIPRVILWDLFSFWRWVVLFSMLLLCIAPTSKIIGDEMHPHIETTFENTATALDAWNELLISAQAAEKNNDDIKALEIYTELLLMRPNHAVIWNRHGLVALRLQDYANATKSFEKAVRDHPVNGGYYESLSWSLLAQGKFAQASEQARTAILMYHRENRFSLYPFFIRYIAEHAQKQSDQAQISLNYAKRNLRDRAWPLPILEYLSKQLERNQLLASVSDLREETEAHLIIGLNEYFAGNIELAGMHLTWVASAGDPNASGQVLAHVFQNHLAGRKLGGLF
jgi:tetratricopeptide (TPR) repeat protein